MDSKVSKQYKDSLFKILFGNKEHKELALMLCNALTGSDHTNVNDVQIVTMDDSFYITIRNDVSVIVCDDLYMFEQQSTFGRNLVLRVFQYLGEQYNRLLKSRKEDLHRYRKVIIPTPHCYIFYNGSGDKVEEQQELHLSDNYANGKGDLELTVHLYNINSEKNGALKEQCIPLLEYVQITEGIKRYLTGREVTNELVSEALDFELSKLPEESLVKEVIMSEKRKVVSTIFHEYTVQEQERLTKTKMEDSKEEGREEGIQIGKEEKSIEIAKNLIGLLPLETISEKTGVSMKQLKLLEKELDSKN